MKNSLIEVVNDFIQTLPNSCGVYAYGSSIYDEEISSNKQIDLMIIVEDNLLFQKENMIKNKDYYSLLSKLFFNFFNKEHSTSDDTCVIPYIKFKNVNFNCTFISKKYFIKNLKEWENFYIAGIFQKEVLEIKKDNDIDCIINKNLKNALIASLVILSKSDLNIEELAYTTTSLSFWGSTDFNYFQKSDKIMISSKRNINFYRQIFKSSPLLYFKEDNNISINYPLLYQSIEKLPCNILKYLTLKSYQKQDAISLKVTFLDFFKENNNKFSKLLTTRGFFTGGVINFTKQKKDKITTIKKCKNN